VEARKERERERKEVKYSSEFSWSSCVVDGLVLKNVKYICVGVCIREGCLNRPPPSHKRTRVEQE